MRFFIGNKHITFTLMFLVILSLYGGHISEVFMEHSPLAEWVAANHVTNAFNGADFSILPAVAVLASIYLVSAILFILLRELADLWIYFTTPPANSNSISAETKPNETPRDAQDKSEPSMGMLPSVENTPDQKENQQ